MNCRFTTHGAANVAMRDAGWLGEGVAFCANLARFDPLRVDLPESGRFRARVATSNGPAHRIERTPPTTGGP